MNHTFKKKQIPTTVARKYKTKDVEMLTATATIVENAIPNKTPQPQESFSVVW